MNISNIFDIYILIGGYWIQVQASDYILPAYNCAACIQSTGSNIWVLGSAVLRGYYAAFDIDNQQMGLTPSIGSTKLPVVRAM